LAAGVAHEIGNPVTGIACLAQNLQHESEPSQILESAQHILSQTDRINRIVESLINFSKGDKSKQGLFYRVNLRQVIEEAIQLLTLGDIEPKVIFIADINSDMNVLGDYHQLVQIFLNLLSNSRDASSLSGQVTILAKRDSQNIRVTVNDSGTGIDQELQSQLYEPFVTTKEPGQGTGLGLWIVFKLVKGLGADISISSPAENSTCGTTVALNFKAYTSDAVEDVS
jgi:signal transduction histidine kinase